MPLGSPQRPIQVLPQKSESFAAESSAQAEDDLQEDDLLSTPLSLSLSHIRGWQMWRVVLLYAEDSQLIPSPPNGSRPSACVVSKIQPFVIRSYLFTSSLTSAPARPLQRNRSGNIQRTAAYFSFASSQNDARYSPQSSIPIHIYDS